MKWLAERYLRLRGWRIEGRMPPVPKFIAIGYPHTSNWDFIVLLAIVGHFDMRVSFLAHHGLFKGPFGWLLRRLGGIPVGGHGSGRIVDEVVAAFGSRNHMIVAIAPEGTRRAVPAWRTGFWRMAEAADVPVVMAYVDGSTKRAGLGPCRRIDGDIDAHWT